MKASARNSFPVSESNNQADATNLPVVKHRRHLAGIDCEGALVQGECLQGFYSGEDPIGDTNNCLLARNKGTYMREVDQDADLAMQGGTKASSTLGLS